MARLAQPGHRSRPTVCAVSDALGLNSEESPSTGDALQGVRPAIHEPKPRTRNQIFYCAREENFARSSMSCDARPDVHCNSCDLVAVDFALACMKAAPDRQS